MAKNPNYTNPSEHPVPITQPASNKIVLASALKMVSKYSKTFEKLAKR